MTVEVETLLAVALHIGAGYGADPEWSHGQWKGRRHHPTGFKDWSSVAP